MTADISRVKTPKISIIIPTYNVEQYLEECMDSVINQTLKDIEIIAVDDGSTDSSGRILDDYAEKDPRIKVIHKPNSGYGHSMNVGLDNASGEYIGIVEPDDYIEPDMYETLYNKAVENDVDLIKADFNRFTGSGETLTLFPNKIDRTNQYYNRVINMQENLTPFKFAMNTWSGIYKRSFIEEHHIRHNTTPGASFQDNGFWFQTFVWAKRAYFLNKPFYMNRRDNINSSVKSKAKVYAMKYEYDFIKNFLEANPEITQRFIGICWYKRFQNYIFTVNRIDKKFKKEFLLKCFAPEFREAEKRNELDFSFFSANEERWLKLIIKNPRKFYYKYFNRKTLLQKTFYCGNEFSSNGKIYKALTICGIKFKFRNKKRELYNTLENIRNISQNSGSEILTKVNALQSDVKNTQTTAKNTQTVIESCCLTEKETNLKITQYQSQLEGFKSKIDLCQSGIDTLSSGNTQLQTLISSENEKRIELEKKVDSLNNELMNIKSQFTAFKNIEKENMYRNIFTDTIKNSEWLKNDAFTCIAGSANYSFLFYLYMVLDKISPNNILEFGLGQTSNLTTQYTEYYKKNLTIVEHNQSWIDSFGKTLVKSNNYKIIQKDLINFEIMDTACDKYAPLDDIVNNTKYNLIVIDGPFGYDRKYPRTNILDLIPQNLAEKFVIILDDAERDGEKNTAGLIFNKLSDCNIKYKKSYRMGMKQQLIISDENSEFIHWY